MKEKFLIALNLILLPAFLSAFESKDIISPAPGTWANRQPLVLDTSDGSELYYSLSGSDPLESGFAYDGPVLIDETGDVSINITSLSKDGVRSDFCVSYCVQPSSVVFEDPLDSLFIQAVSSNPIRKYVSGTYFSIPESFLWCIGNPINPDKKGRQIAISGANNLERYISCTVTEGTSYWHFVIHIVSDPSLVQKAKILDVPFKIQDWETFVFTGQKLIYQIDDEYWTASKEPVLLDRSLPHTVRWQSMDYEFGNPVETFVLPAKPTLSERVLPDGTEEFFIAEDEGFLLGAAHKNLENSLTISEGLTQKLTVDVFEDDFATGTLILGVYYNGVYQGDVSSVFSVDKKNPQTPVISSSAQKSYSRSKVRLTITGDLDSDIYYAVSSPVVSDEGFSPESEALFSSVPQGEFSLYRPSSEISLSSYKRKATYYKVSAYALDKAGNKSLVTDYHVVVDEFNFYLSPQGSALNASSSPDGTYSNPFTSFDEALNALKDSSYMNLHVMGDIVLSEGDTVINTSCNLTGSSVRISIPQNARIVINAADFEAEGILFEREAPSYSQKTTGELFVVNSGSLTLKSCEVVGSFAEKGILIDANSALVMLEGSGLTVQSSSYASVVSSSLSDVTVTRSRLTSVSQVATGISSNGGTLLFDSSSVTLIAQLGRGLELVDSVAHVTESSFALQKDSELPSVAIWKDIDSILFEQNNEESGF